MRNYSGSFFWAIITFVLVIIGVLMLSIWVAFGADTDRPCLTKTQAQTKWPGQWLFWHTAQRCWDNVNTRQARSDPPVRYSVNRNPMQLGKPPVDPNGNAARHSGKPISTASKPSVAYPSLMAGGGLNDAALLRPDTMVKWPLIADFDEDPPQFIPWQRRVISSLPAADGKPE